MTVTSAQRVRANRIDESPDTLQPAHQREMNEMPVLLTLDEVAQILRVHRNTVNHERRAGRLRVVRVGRRVLVDPTDLQNYINKQREATCPTPTDSMNTEATTSSAAPTHQTSIYIGAERERVRSNAEARARAIFRKPSRG